MAPPGGGYHRPNNLSNPYNQYSQQPPQASQFQGHNGGYSHSFSTQGAFAMGQQNQHVNIFGGGLSNGGPPSTFSRTTMANNGGTGLDSQDTARRFAYGAALQQQENSTQASRGSAMAGRIREVWKGNMEQEFAMIRGLIDRYPYISMDTEFPGIVARPIGDFKTKSDYHYQTLRTNVDLLKLIQLGITLWSADGELPPPNAEVQLPRNAYPNNLMMCPCSWTFNFKFLEEEDMSSEDSINMLKKTGVDFEKCATMGIEPKDFGARLIDSGLVCQPDVTWLSFHSGYDFGYLTKVMYPAPMPSNEDDYVKIVQLYFGKIYDVKFLLRSAQANFRLGKLGVRASEVIQSLGTKSGLQDLANELNCMREGKAHTAGSDSLLTGSVFWAIREQIFDNNIPSDYINEIWGLSNVGQPASAASHAAVMAAQTPHQSGHHTDMTPTNYANSSSHGPSTPQNNQKGTNSTPGPHQSYGGSMGAGSAFSSFLTSNGRQAPAVPALMTDFGRHRPLPSSANGDARRLDTALRAGFRESMSTRHSAPMRPSVTGQTPVDSGTAALPDWSALSHHLHRPPSSSDPPVFTRWLDGDDPFGPATSRPNSSQPVYNAEVLPDASSLARDQQPDFHTPSAGRGRGFLHSRQAPFIPEQSPLSCEISSAPRPIYQGPSDSPTPRLNHVRHQQPYSEPQPITRDSMRHHGSPAPLQERAYRDPDNSNFARNRPRPNVRLPTGRKDMSRYQQERWAPRRGPDPIQVANLSSAPVARPIPENQIMAPEDLESHIIPKYRSLVNQCLTKEMTEQETMINFGQQVLNECIRTDFPRGFIDFTGIETILSNPTPDRVAGIWHVISRLRREEQQKQGALIMQ